MFKKTHLAYLLFLFFSLTMSPAHAALPAMVDGKPLPSLAPMLKAVVPAVVNIATRGSVRIRSPLFDDPFFNQFFFGGRTQPGFEKKTQSLGSGVIVDAKRGYIVTNQHVIKNANVIEVTLNDGRTLAAELIGSDEKTDLAVIKVAATGLSALQWGNSDALEVGDFCVAIGNPFGLGQTVTSGIVSALGRSGLGIEEYEDFIQTDAPINPGNSGGALVDLNGHLIGINTAIYGKGGGSVGIGFAIPTSLARETLQQLVKYGEVRRGYLGITMQDLTPSLAQALKLSSVRGSLIRGIVQNSPAHRAGLQVGDVIVQFNDRKIQESDDLRNAIGITKAGTSARLVIIRKGRERILSARIASGR